MSEKSLSFEKYVSMTDQEDMHKLIGKEFSKACVRFTNEFSYKFFADVYNNQNKSVIASSYSLFYLLNLVLYGAQNNTEEELSKYLGINRVDIGPLMAFLRHDDIHCRMWNGLYGKTGSMEIKEEYQNFFEKYGEGNCQHVSFEPASELVDVINGHVASTTNDLIKEIVSENDLQNATFVLLNALYFKAEWLHHFDSSNTDSLTFSLPSGQKKTLDMMQQVEDFYYWENSEYKALKMEYDTDDDEYQMVVMLPKSVVKPEITAESLKDLCNDVEWKLEEVDVTLPKFTVDWEDNLTEQMKRNGVTVLFENADLSELSSVQTNVANIKQKARIVVDELGTEAAAVTEMTDGVDCDDSNDNSVKFVADHPFLYYISRGSGDKELVIFMGYYQGD